MTDLLTNARALAESGRIDEAMALCEAQLRSDPAQLAALDLRASLAFRGGKLPAALDSIRRIAALCPHVPGPRASCAMLFEKIGQALLEGGQGEAAARAFFHALRANPGALSAYNKRTITLFQLGRADEAAAAAAEAVRQHPSVVEFHLNLAVILFESGRKDEAAAALAPLLALVPDHAQAHSTLGQVHLNRGDWPLSRAAFQRAVTLDAEDVRAHLGLYYIGEAQSDHDFAAHHQSEALKRQQVFSESARVSGRATSILVLESPGDFQANLPVGFFLSTERYHLHRYVLVDGLPLRSAAQLPPYDLVFNAVSEPDRTTSALDLAARFIAAQDRPCLNHPDAVAATARDRTARTLRGIDGLLVPEMRRVARADVDAAAEVAGYPILLRPVGSHAGDNLEKMDGPATLRAYLDALDDQYFYLSRFIDYSSADGLFRKYRTIVVDGAPYPCHMAIRNHWMVHYYNAQMELSAEKRAEEERYLADPEAALGSKPWEVLRAIGRRMSLDYFGVDFGLTREGTLVLFEVDVAAIVHLMDDKAMYAYKHRYVPRIFEAAHDMIARRSFKKTV